MEPTIVFVHGAYADASSWNDVLARLSSPDRRMIAFANPLRGLASDAALLGDLVRGLAGPVVLVGHSYGGAVMTSVDRGGADLSALVFVAGFALDTGESAAAAAAPMDPSRAGVYERFMPVCRTGLAAAQT